MSPLFTVTVQLLGELSHTYKDKVREALAGERLSLKDVKLGEQALTIFALGIPSPGAALRIEKKLAAQWWPEPSVAAPTTTIGVVNGVVHSGSGDVNINISLEILLQKLEASLAAAGVDGKTRQTAMQKFGESVQEFASSVAAKFGAELIKP